MNESAERIWLYAGTTSKDKKAIGLLREAGVPFFNIGPDSEIPTPYLQYGTWRWFNADGIKTSIALWQDGRLPDLHPFP